MIFTILRSRAKGTPKVPSMAPRQPKPKMAPGEPSGRSGGLERGPRGSQNGPSGLQERPQEGSKKELRPIEARGPLQDHPRTPPEPLRDPFRDRFWNRSENILSIFGSTQLAPKLTQNGSPHRLDTAVAPAFFPASPRTVQIWGAAGDVAAGVLDINVIRMVTVTGITHIVTVLLE